MGFNFKLIPLLITFYLTSQGRSFGLNSWSMSSMMTSNSWLVTFGHIGCYYDLWWCAELLIAIKISARRNFDSLWITLIYEALQSFGLGWGQAIKSGWRQSISMISPASKMSFIYHIGGARIVDGRSKTLKWDELNSGVARKSKKSWRGRMWLEWGCCNRSQLA